MKKVKNTTFVKKTVAQYRIKHRNIADILKIHYRGNWRATKPIREFHKVVSRKPWTIKGWFILFWFNIVTNFYLFLLLDFFVKRAIKKYCEKWYLIIKKEKGSTFINKFLQLLIRKYIYKSRLFLWITSLYKKQFTFMTTTNKSKKSLVKKIRQSLKSIHLKKLRNLIPTYNINKYHNNCLDTSAWYWHFVDIIWIFVFITIYYWSLN